MKPIKRDNDKALTEGQRHILDYIRWHIVVYAVSPTQEKIAKHFGLSRATIRQRLTALSRKGAIQINAGHCKIIIKPGH